MYRDDPLDDEMELRETVGDEVVDRLQDAEGVDDDLVAHAVDLLHLLLGWVEPDEAAGWFTTDQARLDGRTPVEALVDGDTDEALDAARAWSAARA